MNRLFVMIGLCVLVVLSLSAQVVFKGGVTVKGGVTAGAAASGALAQPLVQPSDISLVGAFTMPHSSGVDEGMSGTAMVWNPANSSIFLSKDCTNGSGFNCSMSNAFGEFLAEMTVPTTMTMTATDTVATYVQTPADPSEGQIARICDNTGLPPPPDYGGGSCFVGLNGVQIGGMVLSGSTKICFWYYGFYDGSGNEGPQFYCRPKDLSDTGHVEGPYSPGTGTDRYLAGPGAVLAADWQALFGFKACIASGMLSTAASSNGGVACYGIDPANINTTPFPFVTVMNAPYPTYPDIIYSTLSGNGARWFGMFHVQHTRTLAMLVGRIAGGTTLYGGGDKVNAPPNPLEIQTTTGSDASTDASNGCKVYLPNKTTVGLAGDFVITLTGETSPVGFIDPLNPTWYQGTSRWLSGGASGTAGAYILVDHCFATGLTGKSYGMGVVRAYDPTSDGAGFHAYPYTGSIFLFDLTDLYHSYIGGTGGTLNGMAVPYASKAIFNNGADSDFRGGAYDPVLHRFYAKSGTTAVYTWQIANVP